mgnify:FL=1
MGRDRATRVTSAARGLGLYRRSDREGFFYVKNLAAKAKRYPGRLKTTYIDEQIRSATGEQVLHFRSEHETDPKYHSQYLS